MALDTPAESDAFRNGSPSLDVSRTPRRFRSSVTEVSGHGLVDGGIGQHGATTIRAYDTEKPRARRVADRRRSTTGCAAPTRPGHQPNIDVFLVQWDCNAVAGRGPASVFKRKVPWKCWIAKASPRGLRDSTSIRCAHKQLYPSRPDVK